MSGGLQRQFFNTCITIDYPCIIGKKYIDPCSCYEFFLCQYETSIISQTCGANMFDHTTGGCDTPANVDIVKNRCKENEPQNRCAFVHPSSNLDALKARCTGTTMPPVTLTPTPGGQKGEPNRGNAGAIAGGVIGGLLLIALIVIIVIFLKKRKGNKPMRSYLSFLTSSKPKDYPRYDNKDETYTEISDVMQDPMYNGSVIGNESQPSVPQRPGFTLSPALKVSQNTNKVKGRSNSEEVAYDNPGYTQSEDDVIEGGPDNTQPVQIDVTSPEENTDQERYTTLDQSNFEVPTTRSYTPLSIYTKGPNNNSTAGDSGGIIGSDYQTPRSIPEYYELDANSSSVTS